MRETTRLSNDHDLIKEVEIVGGRPADILSHSTKVANIFTDSKN